MAGRKGKSGPPGNLNAGRNIRTAIRRLQEGRPLPTYLARVVALADQEAEELISDRGGWDRLSGVERLIIDNWKSARQVELLIWHELIEAGAVSLREDGTWDLQPGVQRLAAFLGVQHRCLATLGLERKQKNVLDLQSYLKEKEHLSNGKSNSEPTVQSGAS